MSLADIVDVQVDATTTTPSRASYGTPMIAAYHTKNTDRIREYESLADMADDNFTVADAAYRAAAAVFSQNPRPTSVKIGRLTTGAVQTVELTPNPSVANSTVYAGTVGSEAWTFTSDGSATIAEWATGVASAINALTGAFTATGASGTKVVVTSDVAGVNFAFAQTTDNVFIANMTPDTSGIAAQLAAISVIDDDWYGVILASKGQAEILAAALYLETVNKIFVVSTNDVLALGTIAATPGADGDVLAKLFYFGYARTVGMWHETAMTTYPEAAWLGKVLPDDPGSNTWAFKTLAGITPSNLTATQKNNLEARNANYYEEVAGISITRKDGISASGEYADITVFSDWLRGEIMADVLSVFVNAKKVPFTDGGIAMLQAPVLGVMQRGADAGGLIRETIVVTVPKRTATTVADRSNRILRTITASADLAGAIHSTAIRVTLSV